MRRARNTASSLRARAADSLEIVQTSEDEFMRRSRQKRCGKKEEEESEVNLTPMLDVVFIMLIFFIVTASFVKETGLDINRPECGSTAEREGARQHPGRHQRFNGQIWIDRRQVDVRAPCARTSSGCTPRSPNGAVVIQADTKSSNERAAGQGDGRRAPRWASRTFRSQPKITD